MQDFKKAIKELIVDYGRNVVKLYIPKTKEVILILWDRKERL